ncbi:MAG: nucleotidyltransferase family protein [Chloroflexota bacterium]|nr:nucleotidyltransferase family protein [Chloroflexota bacterium]
MEENKNNLPVSIVLLAAGSSDRMGTPKQTLNWHGEPLLVHQVQAAIKSKASEVIVILGNNCREYENLLKLHLGPSIDEIHILENTDWLSGKTSSVKLGVQNTSVNSKDIILWAADSPRTAQLINDLIDSHISTGNLITYPWHDNKEGHPGIYSVTLKDEIYSITEEKFGLREIVKKDPNRVGKFISEDELSIVNMNTLADYRKALSLTKQI